MKPKPPLAPRKHLGQNFLVNPRAKDRIIASCDLKKDEEVIEIGPGFGHLTELLLPHIKKIYAIEKDRRFTEILERVPEDQFEVFEGDVLKFDFTQLKPGLKVSAIYLITFQRRSLKNSSVIRIYSRSVISPYKKNSLND